MSKRIRRRGFSLTELLTVMAILVVTMAITIPAIQQARESARQLGCKNNLKQIGLALHNYHDSHGQFPAGWIGVDAQGNHEVSGRNGWGWAAMILPELDSANVFSDINFSKPILDPANLKARQSGPAVFRCPSDPAGNFVDLLTADGNSVLATVARANYVGNFGTGSVAYCNNLSGTGLRCSAGFGNSEPGIFQHNSNVKVAAILDGSSNTIMVSERASKQDRDSTNCATWLGVVPGALDGFSRNLGSVVYIPDLAINRGAGFTSAHPNVVDMLMADGHVRSVSKDISHAVVLAMASRDAMDNLGDYQAFSFSSSTFSLPSSGNSSTSLTPQRPKLRLRRTYAKARFAAPQHSAPVSRSSYPAIFAAAGTSGFLNLAANPFSLSNSFRIPLLAFSRTENLIGSPHHRGEGPEEDQHYFIPDPDGHFTWMGYTPDTVGPLVVKYDYRAFLGAPNEITTEQMAAAEAAMQMWTDTTCGELVFVRDETAADAEVITIGTGPDAVSPCGPGALGCGGGVFVDFTISSGFAWQSNEFTWDTEFDNGDPAGTFDYFTVVAQEIGHALGLGHTDDVGGFGCCGDNIMNGTYDREQTSYSDVDIEHFSSLYGSECGDEPGPTPPGELPPGWVGSD